MAMKKLLFIVVLTGVLLALNNTKHVQACSYGFQPKAAKIVMENVNLAIVWRYSDSYDGYLYPKEETKETLKYPLPGLYPDDGSTTPIWTMPYQEQLKTSFGGRAYISSDRNSFVTIAQSHPGMALVFYHNSKVLKEYSYSPVDARRPKNQPCSWEWFKEVYFDESTGVLVIDHLNGKTFAYSIYTGEPTSVPFSKSKEDVPVFLWLIVGFLALGTIWFNDRRKRRIQKSHNNDDQGKHP
jgi:hypothetical protein